MVTEQEHEQATARGEEMLRTLPRAVSATFDQVSNLVCVELNSGYFISFPPERSQDLAGARPEDLADIEVSYPGFGIYFPKIDADLWIPGMAKGIFGTARWEAAWLNEHPLEDRPSAPRANAEPELFEALQIASEAA